MDHPHIHGEHLDKNGGGGLTSGSPPHTWGTLLHSYQDIIDARITPTYMGNTELRSVKIDGVEDHPHIHGEHPVLRLFNSSHLGSPPHTWGTLIA